MDQLFERGNRLLETRFHDAGDIICYWAKVGAWQECPAIETTPEPWWAGMAGLGSVKIIRGYLT